MFVQGYIEPLKQVLDEFQQVQGRLIAVNQTTIFIFCRVKRLQLLGGIDALEYGCPWIHPTWICEPSRFTSGVFYWEAHLRSTSWSVNGNFLTWDDWVHVDDWFQGNGKGGVHALLV